MTSTIHVKLLKNCSIYLHEDTKSLTYVFCGRRVRCDSMWLVLTELVDFITVCPVDHIRVSQRPQQCTCHRCHPRVYSGIVGTVYVGKFRKRDGTASREAMLPVRRILKQKVKVVFILRSIQSVGPLKALYTFL